MFNVSMKRILKLIILLLQTTTIIVLAQSPRFISHPSSTAVISRQETSVNLECRVEFCSLRNKCILQWFKDKETLIWSNDDGFQPYFKDMYEFIGDLLSNNYEILIPKPDLQTDGLYHCILFYYDAQQLNRIVSNIAHVYVLIVPQQPIISHDRNVNLLKEITFREHTQAHFTCSVEGARPEAVVSLWIENNNDGNGQTTTELILPFDVKSTLNEKLYRVDAIYKIDNVDISMHGKSIICKASNNASEILNIRLEKKLQININTKPTVILSVKPQQVRENDTVQVFCKAESRPPINGMEFYENQVALNINDNNYQFKAHRSQNGLVIACKAFNDIDVGTDSLALQVQYPPVFTDMEIDSKLNASIDLNCQTDANPAVVVTWFKKKASSEGDGEMFLGTGTIYSLSLDKTDKFGIYTCKAKSNVFDYVVKRFDIFEKVKPTILSDSMQFGEYERKGSLICSVKGSPKPIVNWYKNGILLNSIERKFKGGIESRLEFKKIHSQDFGVYNCSSYNEMGGVWKVIELKEKATINKSTIIIAVVIVVAVVIFIIVIIICLIKRNYAHSNDSNSSTTPMHIEPIEFNKDELYSVCPSKYYTDNNVKPVKYPDVIQIQSSPYFNLPPARPDSRLSTNV